MNFKLSFLINKMTKTILISGGCGAIGVNLIKNIVLNKTASEIIVLDNFITSDPDKFETFKNTLNKEIKITLFDFDITNPKMIPFIKERFNNINEIYHLASLASPVAYKKFPLETLDTGYIGTKNMLELSRHYNSKFLLASTSEVYGDAQVSPQTEAYYGNVNSYGARSCYDESKRVAEALVYTYHHNFKVDTRIARIFNTYGPGMSINDGRIVTQTIKSLINNTTLTIFGDGNQTRSCCFVDDTVDMLIKLMESKCNIPVNIGNNEERTINETIDIIEKVYQDYINSIGLKFPGNENIKIKLKKEYIPLTQDDPLKRCPCLKRNKEILGERKYLSFEKGVKEMIKYYIEL